MSFVLFPKLPIAAKTDGIPEIIAIKGQHNKLFYRSG